MHLRSEAATGRARTKTMRRVESATGRDLSDLLTDLYYGRSLTLAEISQEIGVPLGTLGGWMERLGISRSQVARRAIASGRA